MGCREFEHLIALDVEGDLSPADRHRVDLHLRVCSDCWDLAEDLRESQVVFKSLRLNTPDQTMFLTVRRRVLAEAAMDGRSWFDRLFVLGFRQKATLAGVALFALILGSVWWSRAAEKTPRPLAVTPAPVMALETPAAPPPVVAAPKPKVRRREAPPVQPEPQVAIKLLTDDPNVIIYWLVDEKGD